MMSGLRSSTGFFGIRPQAPDRTVLTGTRDGHLNVCSSPIACKARPFELLSPLGPKLIDGALLDGRSGIS